MAITDFSLKGLISKAIWPIAIGVLLYVVVSIWLLSGHKELATFDWKLIPVLLALSLGNYGFRFLKWQYYLRVLDVKLPRRDSLVIFMSGLGLSITPSKLGEVVRSHFLKEGFDVPVSRSAPTVLADRLSDLVALILLCVVGVYSYRYGVTAIWAVAAVVALIFVAITVRPVGVALVRWLQRRLPRLDWQRLGRLEQLYTSSATLLEWRRVLVPVVLAVLAWGCEGTGFYLTLKGLGLHEDLLTAIFIYAFSTIIGAVTLVPGGLGTTEGSLTGLLRLLGIGGDTAALAAIIIRAATLWFGVALGAVFLVVAERRYARYDKARYTTNS
jgi:glycosyltransferase 2 family protein